MVLVAHWCVRLILVGTCQSNAGSIDEHLDDRPVFRLRVVHRPAVQYVPLKAKYGAAEGG
ncbi:hypothetical protein A3K88_18380 [Pseudomonas putida]|nr:hypothetical protein G1E_33070 [Pseudomonas sp. TJI-51]OAK60142.1 hypothetical protein A3K88_18380 [Pseudomonas putida]